MSKSKARFLAELLSSDGKVIKTKSEASTIIVGDLPTIPNSKLANSSVTIAGSGLSLGASLTLDTADVTEHTNYKYYTDARAITAVSGSDLDMSGRKVLFGNVYSGTGDLPSASTYHGMFAHVHGTGKGYFAHSGSWVELANQSDLTTAANAALPKAGGTMTGTLAMGANAITSTGTISSGPIVVSSVSDQQLTLNDTSGAGPYIALSRSNTRRSYIGFGSSGNNLNIVNEYADGATIIGSGNATTLTLDSSQNATFAGTISVSGTVDGVDIATRDAVLTSTTTTAGAALPKAGGTMTGALTGTTATFIANATAGTNALNILGLTNGSGTAITFSDNGSPGASASGQNGYFTYYHGDSQSYGSGNAFVLSSSESTTTILADGKLMYTEGLYIKPSSGTGAGTLLISSSGNLTNIGTISSGAITTSGNVSVGGSAYTTATDLNLLGDGISIKNDKAGSSNNWSLIQNTDTGSASNLSFTTGLGVALTLNHNKSATFGGTITGTTATAAGGTNTTALASTAFVQQEITTLIGGAPANLDTLNELAAAIDDEASYAAGITNLLTLKAPLATPTFTGLVTFNPDSDSGMTIGNGGTNAMAIYTATGDELYIGQTGAYKLRFKTDGNVVMDNGGNFGIGTSSPEKNLSIGSSQAEGIQFNYDTTNNYRNQILNYWNSSSDSRMDFNVARASGDTPSTIMSVGHNSNVGIGTTTPQENLEIHDATMSTISLSYEGNSGNGSSIDFNLRPSSAIASPLTSRIKATDDGAYRQDISFSTKTSAAASSGQTTRMLIKAGGNVGIGEPSPGQKLQVNGNIRADGHYYVGGQIVIDSSRNLTNIGTINSGNIISSGTFTSTAGNRPTVISGGAITMKGESGGWAFGLHALGSSNTNHGGFGFLGGTDAFSYYYIGETYNSATNFRFYKSGQLNIGGTTVIDSSRVVQNVTLGHSNTGARFEINDWMYDTSGKQRLYFEGNGKIYFGSNSGYVFRNSGDLGRATISNNGGLHLLSGGDGQVGSTEALAVGGTTVIDSSRNITGAQINAAALIVNSGTTNVATSFISTDGIVGIKLQDPAGNVELSANGSTFNVQPSGGASHFFVSTNVNSTGIGGANIPNGMRLGFDQSGVRSWTQYAAGGNLLFASGDGNGAIQANNVVTTSISVTSSSTSAIYVSGNNAGLYFTGGNNRIYFTGKRALEGDSAGTNLQLGEGYSNLLLQGAAVVYGNLTPSASDTYDLGSSNMVWRDLYIGDLNLNNETRKNDDGTTGNEIDGTTGNWTVQEGEEHLYLINNKNGKKYKFALEEIE